MISVNLSTRFPPARQQHLYNCEFMGNSAGIHHRYLERAKPGLRSGSTAALVTPLAELPGKILRRVGLTSSIQPQAAPARTGRPTIVLYHGALEALGELADASIDAVVSVSALEHNQPADIVPILTGLQRVTKPHGALYLMVSATRDHEQFHASIHSFLLNESGLIRTYSLTNPRSNFCRYDAIAREFHPRR